MLISNAPVPSGAVRYRLDRLGVPRKVYDAIVTSGDVIASMMVERGDAPVFNIGPSYDRSLFNAVRKATGKLPRRVKLAEADYVICTGLNDPDHEKPADYDTLLATLHERELDFLCANPDIVVHVGPKLMYCAGAIAERFEAMGGRVIQGGKPFQPIYKRALGLGEELLKGSVTPSRVLAIGDTMQTDVKGAIAQSFDSLFIAGGIHQDQLIRTQNEPQLDVRLFEPFIKAAGFAPSAVLTQLRW